MDLPYIHNCHLDTTAATPYNDKGNLDNIPEVYRKQIYTNTAHLDLAKLDTVQAGEVDLRYILMYNKIKTSADIFVPEISTIITT